MPYSTVADLPPAFKNLPSGAKSIAMRTMNAVLEGKEETKELVTQAVQAAWANIEHEYKRQGNGWVKKWLTRKALGEGQGVGGPRQGEGGTDMCVCPDCGARVKHDRGTPCAEVSCPDCEAAMVGEGVEKDDGILSAHDMLAAELQRRGKLHRTPMAKAWYVPIAKADPDKRIVYGIVLQPGDEKNVDAQHDFVTADEIEVAAHDFMRRYRAQKAALGIQHEKEAPSIDIVENYIAPADFTLNGREVLKGSWVMGAYVGDDAAWRAVKDGSLSGFSIGGRGERIAA